MVDFDPRFTETIFFDIECYVPQESRHSGMSSMIFNPAKEDNFVLGGVFRRGFPLQNKLEGAWQVWNWDRKDERNTLQQIYDYFRESWRLIVGKTDRNPDLIAVGTGITRLDIPALYVRSAMHKIDTEAALYETYFKTKIVDLGDAGILLFRRNPAIYAIYPKTTNALVSRLGLSNRKTSGKSVWDMYDARDFEAIKTRTAFEVDVAVEITSKIAAGKF